MRDKVAEVLEGRTGRGISLPLTTLVSVALHAALALPLFLVVTREPVDRPTPVRVRLQRGPVPSPAASAPAPPAPLPVIPPEETPKIDPLQPVAEPKPPTSKIDESVFGRSPEKPSETTEEQPEKRAVPGKQESATAPPPSSAAVPQITVGGGSASVASFDGVEFPFPLYVDRMLSLIAQRWYRPQGGSGNPATVHFVVNRDGRVRDVEITESSGSSTFDRAARRAVIEAAPLPPLPFEYLGTDLGVHLQFN